MVSSARTWRVAVLAIALGGLVVALPAASAEHDPAGPGTVATEHDDPEGCTTATAETQEGCGAQGRDHFGNAEHRPPVEACAERATAGGGRITRILPDGPRRPDGSPAFVTGACVYLPPGYDEGRLRYPVLYLLHGGGGDQADWTTFGQVEDILDRAHADDPDHALIAVMPDGRSGQWYDYEDGSYRFETYVLDHVIPYVDAHLRTIPDRRGRVIAGLSNGGYGTLHLAGKRPDLFVAAGAMSSNLGARGFSGLGPADAVHYQGSVPYQLAPNYDEVDLILDLGTSCRSDVTVDLCATLAVDLAFWPDHIAFANQMEAVGHRGTFDYREAEGAHAWRWWTTWLEERDLPFFRERLLPPQPVGARIDPSPLPESFRYRSVAPEFTVWDHVVAVDRDNREFLDLADVTADGFTATGSGTVTLTTAARHRPGSVFTVEGATDQAQTVVADRAGRLTVIVDLGPSHQADQFTPEARAAEAAGGYWTTREVRFVRTEGTAPPPPSPVDGDGPRGATTRAEGTRGGAGGGLGARAGTALAPGSPGAPGDGGGAVRVDGERATVAVPAADVAGPAVQLLPTVVFLALLATGPTLWWIRRRRGEAS